MKKINYIVIGCYLILCIALVLYGRLNLKQVNYNLFITESQYYPTTEHDFRLYFDFDKIDVQTSLSDIENIEEKAEEILVVTVESEPEIIGNGILDQCKIDQVISSNHFKEGEKVEIYQFILDWNMIGTSYFGGSTPLREHEQYLVFLKKAPNPNKKGTYIYSNIPYGHIILSSPIKTYVDNPMSSISLRLSMDYQYVFFSDTSDNLMDLYKKNCEELIKKDTNK